MKIFFKIIVAFLIGFLSGLGGSYFIEFYFQPGFTNSLLKVVEKKEIIINSDDALQDAVEKVEKSVILLKAKLTDGKTLFGSGIIVTSDGLVVTLADFIPSSNKFSLFLNNKEIKTQVLKKDLKNNLALLKLKGSNFKTCGFADYNDIKIGETIFSIGFASQRNNFPIMLDKGIIRLVDKNGIIVSNIGENGNPLFDLKGNLVGLNEIGKRGLTSIVSIKKIKTFLGF